MFRVQAMRAFLYGPSAINSLDELDTVRTRPRAYKLNTQYTTINTISFITMIVHIPLTVVIPKADSSATQIYFSLSGARQLEPKTSNNTFDFDGFFNMRLQSLGNMRTALPKHFNDLIEHYDLLVHGMSGSRKILGGTDTQAQIRYQADLLKSFSELHDSDKDADEKAEGEDEDNDEGQGE